MWIKHVLVILSLTLQSCSTYWSVGYRDPASIEDFQDLIAQMKSYKARLVGSEQDSSCTKEKIDEDFQKLLAKVKVDSCSENNVSIDREELIQKSCPKIKTKGYFDNLVEMTIKEEKSKKKLSFFQNKIDPKFDAFISEAKKYLNLLNHNVARTDLSHSERAEILAEYVENVLLPVRDVVVIMHSYLPKEIEGHHIYLSLTPTLTAEFVNNLKPEELGLITQGPNPATQPFYLQVDSNENGFYRLGFSRTDIIRRDVLTLLKAPTARNYVMALKWMTLHMMLSQIYLYDTILGNRSDFNIPNSCQNHFNGNLPSKFKFNYEEGLGEEFLENILAGHGLTYSEGDSNYLDYYIDNVNKDPMKEGYSGLIPFENYKNALRSTEPRSSSALEPHFDDQEHFKTIMSFKMGEALSVFRGKVRGQNVLYAGHDTFQKIVGEFNKDEIAEIKISENEARQIYPGKQNLSPYLLEVMQENGFVDYSELITEKMKKKFVGKKVNIDFPSMYSSPVWRDWSLRLLTDKITEYKDAPLNSQLYRTVTNLCLMNSRKSPELLKICQKGNVLLNLSDYLSEFRSGEKYIPTKRLEEKKFKELYPFLGAVWQSLRDQLELLPEAKPFELNFLLDQMSAGNPWARLKFGYMVALDQLEHQEDGIIPRYDTKNHFNKNNQQVMCKINNVTVQYNSISRAGERLGLNKALSYNHGGTILSQKEKEQVWRHIYQDIEQRNAQLFSVKTKSQNYYQMLENISYKTILTEDAALNSGVSLSQQSVQEIKKSSEMIDAQLGKFFLSLYSLKDTVKQQALFEEFSKKNGIDNSFSLKLNLLALDNSFKKPIYKDVLKQAAHTRKMQVSSQLDSFCRMDINNEVELKNIFYSASKAQNEINQMAGLPSVPKEVLDQINQMTASEWRDMWWGIGSGVAGIAALIVGGACTTLSGGICAPLGGMMVVAGLGSLGIQVKLTSNELDRKVEADLSEKQVKIMEELGFSSAGSSEEVSRTYAWAAFEAMSIFPLIGVATRSLTLGPKLIYVSNKSMMRQTGKTSFKAAAKSVTQEEEVRAAQYLLGISSVSKNLGIDSKTIETASMKIKKIKTLYTKGEITQDVMFARIETVLSPLKRTKLAMAKTVRGEVGKVTVKANQGQIDSQTSKMVSQYFGDNPRELLRLIQGYSGERLNRSLKVMNELNVQDRIGKSIPIYSGARDWFLRMRNESLAKNASKILRIEKELSTLSLKPGEFEKFINKNIEDLTDIFIEIPMKKREIPYFVFVQGMPDFNFIKGRKIPFLSSMSEGQTLRRIFTARARLVHETYKAQARSTLRLPRYVQSETTFNAFKSFQLSVAELANRESGKESLNILKEYRLLEEQLAKKLYSKTSNDARKMSYSSFKDLIFNPVTMKDKAAAEAIWESVPASELMGQKELGIFAHKAAQALSTYKDIDSFQRYLNALKILTINRNPAVLEVM